MTTAEHLVARAAASGWRIELRTTGPALAPINGETTVPGKLLADLKANRKAVVEHLEKAAAEFTEQQCAVCRATWYEQPTAELAAILCDRGGGKAHKDMNGVKHAAEPRCPFKEPRR